MMQSTVRTADQARILQGCQGAKAAPKRLATVEVPINSRFSHLIFPIRSQSVLKNPNVGLMQLCFRFERLPNSGNFRHSDVLKKLLRATIVQAHKS